MTSREIRKYDFIDALRGYAILMVIMAHSSQAVAPLSPLLQRIMSNGANGVQLFYIASALTLCLSWKQRSIHEASPFRNFLIRRFFRIAPLFYLAILVYSLLYGFAPRYWAPNGIEWWYLPLTALFLNGFHPETINSVVPGGWSIAVEMSFYLVLPYLLTKITSRRHSLVFLALSLTLYVLVSVLINHIYLDRYPADQRYLVFNLAYLNFFAQLPVFAIGIVTFFSFTTIPPTERPELIGRRLLFTLVTIPLLALLFSRQFTGGHILFGGVFGLAAIALGAHSSKLLVSRWICQLGKLSFSMYLAQFAVFHWLAQCGFTQRLGVGDAASLLNFLLAAILTALASYTLYRAVESYGISMGKWLVAALERPPMKH